AFAGLAERGELDERRCGGQALAECDDIGVARSGAEIALFGDGQKGGVNRLLGRGGGKREGEPELNDHLGRDRARALVGKIAKTAECARKSGVSSPEHVKLRARRGRGSSTTRAASRARPAG